jgi:hypothetical protein
LNTTRARYWLLALFFVAGAALYVGALSLAEGLVAVGLGSLLGLVIGRTILWRSYRNMVEQGRAVPPNGLAVGVAIAFGLVVLPRLLEGIDPTIKSELAVGACMLVAVGLAAIASDASLMRDVHRLVKRDAR